MQTSTDHFEVPNWKMNYFYRRSRQLHPQQDPGPGQHLSIGGDPNSNQEHHQRKRKWQQLRGGRQQPRSDFWCDYDVIVWQSLAGKRCCVMEWDNISVYRYAFLKPRAFYRKPMRFLTKKWVEWGSDEKQTMRERTVMWKMLPLHIKSCVKNAIQANFSASRQPVRIKVVFL